MNRDKSSISFLFSHRPRRESAFTLIELLLVIAVIGIMSALIVAAISNSASDTRLVIARQQQAVLQESLNAWIAAQSSGTNSLQDARSIYNAASNRLTLIQNYLDPSSYEHMAENTTDAAKVKTEALAKESLYLSFTTWTTNSYPRVNMVTDQ
ncbi:MAG: type II secretion system protein [Terrimicrobiaceae bacterium]